MLAVNNTIHVFDKYDSNESHLPKDFDIIKIPREGDPQGKWQQQELDAYAVEDRKKSELVTNAGSVEVERGNYLIAGGRKLNGSYSSEMHFINLEMQLNIKISTGLVCPMSPCYMFSDVKHIRVMGGVKSGKHEDMF